MPSVYAPSSDVEPADDAELALERLDHLLRARERARDVRADLDHASPDGLEVELVVEGRDRHAVGGRELERVRDLADRVRREPAAVLLLGEPERRHAPRTAESGYCLRSFWICASTLIGRRLP